jgi:4-hydroxybenzoate polyprenyltransferase
MASLITKKIYTVLNFILFGHIFIALCALAQVLVTYYFFALQPSFIVCSFLFFATIVMYNCSLLLNKPASFKTSKYKRIRCFFTHQKLNIGITSASVLVLLFLFLRLSIAAKIVVFFLGLVSFAYLVPICRWQKKTFSLRNISGLKLFVIAFVWAASVVLLPVLQVHTNIPISKVMGLWVQKFVFFMAIALPFDIKDRYDDKAQNINTLPTIYGAKKANLFCFILWIFFTILLFVFNNGVYKSYFFASLVTILLAVWLLLKIKFKNNEYNYFLLLDGILLAQYLLVIFFDLSYQTNTH